MGVVETTYEARARHDRAVHAPRPARLSGRAQSAIARFAVDATMLAAALSVAQLGSAAVGLTSSPVVWRLAFACLVLALFALRGAYAWRLNHHVADDLRLVVTSTVLAAMAVLSLRVLVADGAWSPAQTIRDWAFATVYVSAGRIALRWCEIEARRRGALVRPTLIVGAGHIGQLAAKRLLDHPELGLRPVGFLDKEPRDNGTVLPVLGASWDLERVVPEYEIQQVVVTFSTAPSMSSFALSSGARNSAWTSCSSRASTSG